MEQPPNTLLQQTAYVLRARQYRTLAARLAAAEQAAVHTEFAGPSKTGRT